MPATVTTSQYSPETCYVAYGPSFPQRLPSERLMERLRGKYQFGKVYATAIAGDGDNLFDAYDYLENMFVHILKFQNYQFAPE